MLSGSTAAAHPARPEKTPKRADGTGQGVIALTVYLDALDVPPVPRRPTSA
jgi:hypothetical protein